MRKTFILAFAALLGASAALAATKPTAGPAPQPLATPAAPAAASVAPPPAPPGEHALSETDLHAFFDGLVPYAIHRGDIAGATIAVVKDGQILFAQGYGFADLKAKKPVVADQTLFRPGSVSKLFTWTAVMQQVEQGKLDLDRDINTYLDFKIPEKFGKPITLRNCMTHTAGFEEMITDTFVGDAKQMYPMGKYLATHIPERIYPPGQVVAYSNYATAVAGYIVQRVSGEPFDQYIANHIFKPLRMEHSSFAQPLPKSLQPGMATGYMQASEAKPVNFEFVEAAPAGALSSTATDMARFMMAHLEHGSYEGGQILKPETVALMQSRNHTLSPDLLNGFNLGFYDENRNGHRIIGHAGDTEPFHSDLHLITDANTGLFMSFNSIGKEGAAGEVRVDIFRAFLDRYFPFTPKAETPVADPSADNAKVAGWYGASRKKESSLKLLSLLGQASVTVNDDKTISVSVLKDSSGAVKRWQEVGPLLYRETNGQTLLKFVTDANGNVDFWQSDDFIPVEQLLRMHGLEQSSWIKLLTGLSVTVLLATLLIWFGGWIIRWRFARPLVMTQRERQLRLAARLSAIVVLLVPVGWLGFITLLTADESLLFGGGVPWLMTVLYVIGLLAILGSLVLIAHAVMRLLNGPGRWLARSGEVLLGLVGLYAIYAVVDYGLVSFNTLF